MIVSGLKALYAAQTAFAFHGDYSKELCAKHRTSEYLPNIDHIGCRSMSASREVRENLRLHEEPFVCASGVPDSFVEKYTASGETHEFENSLSILTAVRLVASKSIGAVIKASARALPAEKYSLTIAGEGPLIDEYQTYAREHSLTNTVFFLGRISREMLQERMQASDVFVLISRGETFGLVYIEAMLHGCIVVASRFGGVDGILVDGENGFLCNAGDEAELASVLLHTASLSVEKKKKISRSAIETAKNNTDSKVAARYLAQITV